MIVRLNASKINRRRELDPGRNCAGSAGTAFQIGSVDSDLAGEAWERSSTIVPTERLDFFAARRG
jgi:hypothetical protein